MVTLSSARTFLPNYAVTPGEFVREWLDDNGTTAAELARRLGVSRKHVSELLHAKVALTADMAVKLEGVTGVPARKWSNLEALYRADRARLSPPCPLQRGQVGDGGPDIG
ncbi:MAG: HigA family addiction module antidote protein [Propionibacteriaceae bacterium]|nr:HigA family addiction module antidote protein [Propionibacteriaceae bacterium]